MIRWWDLRNVHRKTENQSENFELCIINEFTNAAHFRKIDPNLMRWVVTTSLWIDFAIQNIFAQLSVIPRLTIFLTHMQMK